MSKTKKQPAKPAKKKKPAPQPGPGRPENPDSVTRSGKPLFVKLLPELDDKLEAIIAKSEADARRTGEPPRYKDRSDFVRKKIEAEEV